MIELYRNIRSLREQRGLSQDELAKMTGYTSRSSIAKIEKGEVDLTRSKILAFAKALNIAPGILMGWCSTSDINNIQEINQQERTYHLNSKEELLLTDFRTLNEQGQDYILQTMDMVKDKYKKSDFLSDLEEIV
ncbi:MAG: helix-turn-helix domain-containing protein [Lachnospiraceae bacterium]|nr:helix-turn-helix domain-containing protein [Lachnospiraceae bacterium]